MATLKRWHFSMSRPLRLEFGNALYQHRGERLEPG